MLLPFPLNADDGSFEARQLVGLALAIHDRFRHARNRCAGSAFTAPSVHRILAEAA